MTVTPTTAAEPDTASPSRGGWLAFAGIAMLVAALTILRRALGQGGGDVALSIAYVSLPLLTLAGITAGAAVGLWATEIFPRVPRIAASVLAGSLTGALASASVLLVRGMPGGAIGVVALALALAGALGGAIASIRPEAIVRGGAAATLVALLLFFVVAFNSGWLLRAFGADGTLAGNEAANGLLAGAQALTVGLVGGMVAFWVMRLSKAELRWPAYLLAGGMPGLLWIVGDLFTRVGTARLLALATSDTAAERLIQSGLGAARINTGLVLFFVGALTAMIAFGRTLPRKTD